MKRLLLSLALLTLPQLLPADSAITVYNDNFAVVRETLSLDLNIGRNSVEFSEITSQLEPSSIVLRDLSGERSLRILEQNYRADPLSQELLLGFFEGETIEFEIREGEATRIVEGKIIRAPYRPNSTARLNRYDSGGGIPIIEIDGRLRFGLPGTPLFPELGNDSILKPTLHWELETDVAGESDAELSYLTNGMSWEAAYNLVSPEKGDIVDLIGWITIENQSGRTFNNAAIKLLAGDVHRVRPAAPTRARMEMATLAYADAAPEVTERSFDEYHLYDLNRSVTLRDRETKQVEFVRAEGVVTKLTYVYEGMKVVYPGSDPTYLHVQQLGTKSQEKVWIMREFENTRENKLGIPLPRGITRFYRQDIDERLEFTGENLIDHTPRNETVSIYTGNAFDLVGERTQTGYQIDTSRRWIRETYEINLRNRKEDETVTIVVRENLFRAAEWEIEQSSHDFEKSSSRQIEFPVEVEPDSETTVTYTVFYKW